MRRVKSLSWKKANQLDGQEKSCKSMKVKSGRESTIMGLYGVEGQWVFGGIQEDSRDNFIFTVKDRSEDTLILITEKWIAKGTKLYQTAGSHITNYVCRDTHMKQLTIPKSIKIKMDSTPTK